MTEIEPRDDPFANYCLKVTSEVIATPLTDRVVGFLKRAESVDHDDTDTDTDTDTDLTPFSLET